METKIDSVVSEGNRTVITATFVFDSEFSRADAEAAVKGFQPPALDQAAVASISKEQREINLKMGVSDRTFLRSQAQQTQQERVNRAKNRAR
jgi:hypothetical protein